MLPQIEQLKKQHSLVMRPKSRRRQSCVPFWKLWGRTHFPALSGYLQNSVPLIQFWTEVPISLTCGPCVFKPAMAVNSFSYFKSPWLSLLPSAAAVKASCAYTEPTWVTWDNFPTLRSTVLNFICKVLFVMGAGILCGPTGVQPPSRSHPAMPQIALLLRWFLSP